MTTNITDKLIQLLREFNELDNETKRKVFVQAGMTDSDFDRLRIDVVNLEDDIEMNIRDNLDLKKMMLDSCVGTDLILLAFECFPDLSASHINDSLKNLDDVHPMICLELFTFDELSAQSQRRAIKDAKQNLCKDIKMTNDQVREELMSTNNAEYLIDGHQIDLDNL